LDAIEHLRLMSVWALVAFMMGIVYAADARAKMMAEGKAGLV
jgi:hypothetical protein